MVDTPKKQHTQKILGEALTEPVFWRGREWAVTGYGIEKLDGRYAIKRSDIWEAHGAWTIVNHMEEKGWVDMSDFKTALRIAKIFFPNKN